MLMRRARSDDFPAILAMNLESEHFLSPLDLAGLEKLDRQAALHQVVERDGRPVAFLLVLAEHADYASPNYRWFADRYDRFLYVDRVVVARAARGTGAGRRLYESLFRYAATHAVPRVACEIDVEPPNPGSAAFHDRFGFREVGQQAIRGGAKRVSLRLASIRTGA